MDTETAMLAVSIIKNMEDSSAVRAETAAQEAEQSAEIAATHNYGISISGKRLVITEPNGV